MNPTHWNAFLRVLNTTSTGEIVTVNTLRDLLAAADIPTSSRGGLFAQAVTAGYLKPASWEASEGETAHRSPVRRYRRTRTRIDTASAAA